MRRVTLVTITSALGRSSLYNRVKLPDLVELVRIGSTNGWGHFHVPDDLFSEIRTLLRVDQHKYSNGHQYGDGPNWKIRVIRKTLGLIGLDEELLRHGIEREVFAMPLAKNWKAFLTGKHKRPRFKRPNSETITAACLERWILPRSVRMPEYRNWSADDIQRMFQRLTG